MSEKILTKMLIKTWREDPDMLQSLGPPRVRHSWAAAQSPVIKTESAQTWRGLLHTAGRDTQKNDSTSLNLRGLSNADLKYVTQRLTWLQREIYNHNTFNTNFTIHRIGRF